MDNLTTILGIALLEKTDRRILVSYNENGILREPQAQREFEQKILALLNGLYQKSEGETHVLTVEGLLIVVNIYSDFYLLVVADERENEVVLADLVATIHSAALVFCGKEINTKLIYRFYPQLALLLNEVFDNGLILTTNSTDLVARVLMQDSKKSKGASTPNRGGMMNFFNFNG